MASLKRWGYRAMAWVLVAALPLACAGKAGDTLGAGDGGVAHDETAGGAGWGGAGGGGAGGGGGTGGGIPMAVGGTGGNGATMFEPCDSSSPRTDAGPPEDAGAAAPSRLGFSSIYTNTTLEGRVNSIHADRLELETQSGSLTFYWRGPSLASAFDVGETVQIVYRRDGFSSALWNIVRSERATAAAVEGDYYVDLPTTPGSTATVPRFEPGFPELVYSFVSCCSQGFPLGGGSEHYTCDYSTLEARLDGDSTPIALGATRNVGQWALTNLRSTYYNARESGWDLGATLLGPATGRSSDGGI